MRSQLDIANDGHPRTERRRAASDDELPHAVRDVDAGFDSMQDAALATGALSTAAKELIALAIAVTRDCRPRIELHARAVAEHGVVESELAEALAVAVAMNGGTGEASASQAWAAFRRAADRMSPPTDEAGPSSPQVGSVGGTISAAPSADTKCQNIP